MRYEYDLVVTQAAAPITNISSEAKNKMHSVKTDHIIVLGAGMVGITSALALQESGFNVTVVELGSPGREASYGNAGIIQTEAAEPYALPQDFPTLASYLFERSNDVVWTMSGVLSMRRALTLYNQFSKVNTHKALSQTYSQLTSRSTQDHAPLIEASEATHLIRKSGLFLVYRNEQKLEKATKHATTIKERYGRNFRILNGHQYKNEEPALKSAPAGAIHWQDSWSCSDPGALTNAYASLFLKRGGQIVQGDAKKLSQTQQGWRVLETSEGNLEAQHAVICLGHTSPEQLKPLGYRIPMIYKRGYHAHFASKSLPRVPFLDVENGILASAMTKGVRLTSGAALVSLNSLSDPKQIRRGQVAIRDLLNLEEQVQEPQWLGVRPCLPDMLPLVGPAPNHKGLWFNFGHGHQGFTLGPTTANILADQMEGKENPLSSILSPAARTWL
ncbi:NAD(P)/FAD-dependent oxidoreductase [Marinomonas mediterranea]|uniref:D-amino-acid dehydrogenase n=3 Tax=Marinomonas mediterranea TaxID=119864 RepID=F2JUK8_MARM1|nr:FAD-binding oxidoreductase [Marinomonas mediterranea]ADZ89341.1 D-amino-acid dehydrogenase [Marinomonas mediterranea MMB-1]